MVMATIASRDFNWQPDVVVADDPRVFARQYVVKEEATTRSLKGGFADIPSASIWQDRTETDSMLLEQLSGDWRGFAIE